MLGLIHFEANFTVLVRDLVADVYTCIKPTGSRDEGVEINKGSHQGIRKTQIRDELSVVPLLDDIDRKKLRRYGRVKRMTEEENQSSFLNGFQLVRGHWVVQE